MSRLHVVEQFTFGVVPTVALTTGDSSHLWLCHIAFLLSLRLPPLTVRFYLRTPRAGAKGIDRLGCGKMWWLWKTSKVMPRFRPPTSIEKHWREQLGQFPKVFRTAQIGRA